MNRKVYAKSEFRGYIVNLYLVSNMEGHKSYIWAASNGLPVQISHKLFFNSKQEAINHAEDMDMNVKINKKWIQEI